MQCSAYRVTNDISIARLFFDGCSTESKYCDGLVSFDYSGCFVVFFGCFVSGCVEKEIP